MMIDQVYVLHVQNTDITFNKKFPKYLLNQVTELALQFLYRGHTLITFSTKEYLVG